MRDLRFLPDRLEDINKELGVSSYAGFLEEAQRKLAKITAEELVYVDVYHHSQASLDAKKYAAALKDSTTNSRYAAKVMTESDDTVKVFEQIFAALAIVLVDDAYFEMPDLKHRLQQLDEQYKVVIAVNFSKAEDAERKLQRGEFSFKVKVFVINHADAAGKTLPELVQSVMENDKIQQLNKLAYCNSVKPIFGILQDIFSSENRTIQTRKLLNNQNVNITRKDEQNLRDTDVMSSVRTIIQKEASELEKIFRGKYDDLNKPNVGEFSQKVESEVSNLQDFERAVMAEKNEKVQVTISPDFLQNYTLQIRRKMNTELQKDEEYVKSSYKELINKINNILKTKSIAPINAEDVYAHFPKQERVLDSYCYLAKTYTGELIKKGAQEYFVALRDYVGIIMVAVGILAPLNGITALESDLEGTGIVFFFKKFNSVIRGLTAVLTIGMISYGIYDLKKRIPLKRVEEFNKEMTKAKEMLTQEGKRMFNEASRDWNGAISNWMRETAQNIQVEIEKNMKDLLANRAQKLNNEKQQQQRLQQSIELIGRNIQSAEKVKDQMVNRFRDIVSETEKELKF